MKKEIKENMHCLFLGGSHLYGLNTPDSDEDLRGVYATDNLADILGLNGGQRSNVKCSDVEDHVFYEIKHFMNLLQKTNPNILEFLFIPRDHFRELSDVYSQILINKYSLINSENIFNSFFGYMTGETKQVLGERTGRSGSKRKSAIDEYGYSPKNMCNLIRLFHTGVEFFETGEFKTNITGEPYFDECYDVKVNPQNYTFDEIEKRCHDLIEKFKGVKNQLDYKFNQDIACDILLDAYHLEDRHLNNLR